MKTWPTWLSIVVASVVFLGILVYGHRGAAWTAWTAYQTIGIAIAVPAFCLWALARVQLRKSFAISAQATELVTRGLYSKIQNPVYVFGAILIAGLIIYLGQSRLFVLFLILIPVQLMRIRSERRMLEANFGEAYREYRRRTWI